MGAEAAVRRIAIAHADTPRVPIPSNYLAQLRRVPYSSRQSHAPRESEELTGFRTSGWRILVPVARQSKERSQEPSSKPNLSSRAKEERAQPEAGL